MHYEICKLFASMHDWSALKLYFENVLEIGATPSFRVKVRSCIANIATLEDAMDQAFHIAVSAAEENPLIRAIYFEYNLSSGEYATGDFFLCHRYSTDAQDDWAASFKSNGEKNLGYVEGPNIHTYIDFDPELELSGLDSGIGHAYGFAYLLATLGQSINRAKYRGLPFGFAEHDSGDIVYIVS